VRGVFEDPSVAEEVDQARDKWIRADDVWTAVTWVLARDPTVGYPLSESGSVRAFTYDGARSAKMPTVVVVYTIDATDITIRATTWSDAKFPAAGHA
jgi:hypothetical protein